MVTTFSNIEKFKKIAKPFVDSTFTCTSPFFRAFRISPLNWNYYRVAKQDQKLLDKIMCTSSTSMRNAMKKLYFGMHDWYVVAEHKNNTGADLKEKIEEVVKSVPEHSERWAKVDVVVLPDFRGELKYFTNKELFGLVVSALLENAHLNATGPIIRIEISSSANFGDDFVVKISPGVINNTELKTFLIGAFEQHVSYNYHCSDMVVSRGQVKMSMQAVFEE